MATQQSSGTWAARGVHKETWPALGDADTGSSLVAPSLPFKTVTCTGTWGVGGGILIEGSEDGAAYSTLNDENGNPLLFSANATKKIREMPTYIRPRATGGDGTTAVKVYIVSQVMGF
jgi:hypothetical protein